MAEARTILAKLQDAKLDAKSDSKKTTSKKKADSKSAPLTEEKIKNDPTLLNNEIQKILSKAGYQGEDIGFVSSLVTKSFGKTGYKQTIYRSIISKFGQAKGLGIYNHIKKHI